MGYTPYAGTRIGPDGLRRPVEEEPDDIYVREPDDIELELQLADEISDDPVVEEIAQTFIEPAQTGGNSTFSPEPAGHGQSSPLDTSENSNDITLTTMNPVNDVSALEQVRLDELRRRSASTLAEVAPEGPTHVGAGWYLLDSGQRVRGKAEARAAWDAERKTLDNPTN